MNSILRWAGSKRKLLNVLQNRAPVSFGKYYEPFAGSAALYFKLQPKHAVLGDINPEIISMYRAVKSSPREVLDYIESIPTTKEGYLTVRALEPKNLSENQRAARLIFIMKACFNGVYRTNRAGAFNVPLGSRFYRLPSKEEIDEASRVLSNTVLRLGDYSKALDGAEAGDFVYLDPPYSDGNRFRGEYSYDGAFSVDDRDRFLKTCADLTTKKVKILVSFKLEESFITKLKGWNVQKLDVPRSVAGFASSRVAAAEIIATNY
ncbi:Dam family site-specific DNA-(adenine-N6)-methyltransferase [Paucibacter sp. B2R-40]|uniref:DNA adenine methylase n=1 Tax=Paucibacter sp. B2R-40 TaxID=2893554 RepID=UPI0021E3C36D|nr:Dam family site-specific DNA-(adenine-N6)-methyltransferase [Paucibacter sp. B2R-40]MCV2356613.1 Dam family site-specific DNA-(adenine-N6)-methyltransferase [Paucibacter sp. B2R-40]